MTISTFEMYPKGLFLQMQSHMYASLSIGHTNTCMYIKLCMHTNITRFEHFKSGRVIIMCLDG